MQSQLELLIRSRHSLIALETADEERATEEIRAVANRLGCSLFEWSVTSGLVRTSPPGAEVVVKPGKATAALEYVLGTPTLNGIYWLKDWGAHCKEPLVLR